MVASHANRLSIFSLTTSLGRQLLVAIWMGVGLYGSAGAMMQKTSLALTGLPRIYPEVSPEIGAEIGPEMAAKLKAEADAAKLKAAAKEKH